MSTSRKVGTAYQEALAGLCGQFSRQYRESCMGEFLVDCYLIQGDTLICLEYKFPANGDEGWVPLEIGAEGWSESRRQRLIADAQYVLGKRLELEKFTAQYVDAKVREVLRAYR